MNAQLFSLPLRRRGVSSNDFPCLENLCKKIIKEKQPFERLEVKKETLLEMFKVWVLPLTWFGSGRRELMKEDTCALNLDLAEVCACVSSAVQQV